MKTIYIVDLIGSYCGMHYYDEAFADILRKKGSQVKILSTFNEQGEKPFFSIIFGRNKLISVLLLLKNYLRLLKHMITHKRGVYIYMCYGELYDLLMMSPGMVSRRLWCDMHEAHALKYIDTSRVLCFFDWYYTKYVRCFIYHSERTKNILNTIGVKVPMLYVPHLKYSFKKKYEEKSLSKDVANAFVSIGKIKFLFFGNLSHAKGIDIIVDVFARLPHDVREKVELVIAGKNVENIDFSLLCRISTDYRVLDRHINDDELVYLYSHTDVVLLPYRKSSQSGIFAMACYFKKVMLLTDIPYFRKMIDEFPSFGRLTSINKYRQSVEDIIKRPVLDNYYTTSDCERYEQKKEINDFVTMVDAEINRA